MFGNLASTQSLVVSCKYWVVPLISTRVSSYCQAILLISVLQCILPILLQCQGLNDAQKSLTQLTELLPVIRRTIPLGVRPPPAEEGVAGRHIVLAIPLDVCPPQADEGVAGRHTVLAIPPDVCPPADWMVAIRVNSSRLSGTYIHQ